MLDEETKRALNGVNSKMVSAITGRTPHEEATAGSKTYDIVAGIRATRLRWLGQILRMDEKRMVQRAARTLYENPRDGDLLMDAPATATWEELKEKAMDEKEWAQAVRRIKDGIYISTLGKGRKRKNKKAKKASGKKKRKDGAKREASTASAANNDNDEDEEKDDDDEGWAPRDAGPRKRISRPIRCHDGFVMSVQASRDHYCTPRDDVGPYSAVEVGWPNRLEERLLPYADKATTTADARPTLYVNVPVRVIHEVVAEHAGICSGQLPPTVELDEDGYAWAAAAIPPSDLSSMEEGYADEEEEESEVVDQPTSVVQLGLPPPLPPPLPHTTVTHGTGPLQFTTTDGTNERDVVTNWTDS